MKLLIGANQVTVEKRKNDLLDRVESELELNENNILEFSNLESKILHSFNFVSNVYHDVELVEVASFNGYAPNKFPFQFEKQPKSSDEKSQQNRFFTEVLDMILTGGFYE